MANGWGGRRPGAGAPKGNNNAVKHGDYCRPKVDIDCSRTRELRVLNATILRIRMSLPDIGNSYGFEFREYQRLDGMSNWVTDKIIQVTRKNSRDRVKQAEAERNKAKVELMAAKAEFMAAKARLTEVKAKKLNNS